MQRLNILNKRLSSLARMTILMFCASSIFTQSYAQNKVVVIPLGNQDSTAEPFKPVAPDNPADGNYTLPQLFLAPGLPTISDGTVIDNTTGLMWQRSDDGNGRTWDNAWSYCQNLSLGGPFGFQDWRLPSKSELISIVDYGEQDLSINSTIFLNTRSLNYWSATSWAFDSTRAKGVFFGGGFDSSNFKTSSSFVRCVR